MRLEKNIQTKHDQFFENYSTLSYLYDYIYTKKLISPWLNNVNQFLKQLNINRGCLIDIGAGTASAALFWTREGFKTYCLDISFEMLSDGKRKNKDLNLICGTYNCIKNNKFDVITSFNDVVNHIAFQEESLFPFFEKVYLSLKKSGVFIFNILTLSVCKWLNNDLTYEIDENNWIKLKYNISYNQKFQVLEKLYYITHSNNMYLEMHKLAILNIQLVKSVLSLVGFETILIGDFLFQGKKLLDLPIIDIAAIK